jgi:ketosteroid isomerase-like protein
LEFVAEDVVAREVGQGFRLDTPSVFHGRDALLGYWERAVEVFDDYVREVDEYVDAGDWVITVGRWTGKGKGSGVPIELRVVNAVRCREGKIVDYLLGFESKEAALEAVRSWK